KLKLEVCKLLKEQGFIRDFRQMEKKEGEVTAALRIILRYSHDGTPAISSLARISRPGRRVYRGAKEVQPVRNGMGVAILSTSQGLRSDARARERGIGGELMCEVW